MNSPSKPVAELCVAIVGYGSIGRRHCDNLGRLGVKRRVVVRRADAANRAFTPPLDVAVVNCSAAAIDQKPDLAIICNPTSHHVSSALQFIAAGVPTLVEKPLAHRLDDAGRILDEARRVGTSTGIAYSMRYHPAYSLACQSVRRGRLGRMLYAKAWFETYLPDWHPWEDYRQSYAARRDLGGGVLPTLDHEIDFLNWCLGVPEAARGNIAQSGTLGIDAPDVATLSIAYGGNVLASVVLSLCRPCLSRGFEFVGSDARLRYDFDGVRLELHRSGSPSVEVLWDAEGYDLNEMYVEMLSDVLASVVAGRALPIPLQAGFETIRLIDGLQRSHDLHCPGSRGPIESAG